MTEPQNDILTSAEACTPAIMALREKITREMDKKTMFDSIADMAKLVTGPLVAIGCSTLIGGFVNTAASAILFPCGIGLLIAGAAALTTSIVASYNSTKINRATSFDRGELDRMRSAQHLVEAMKQNNVCITNEPERAHTKAWTQSVEQSADKTQQPSL